MKWESVTWIGKRMAAAQNNRLHQICFINFLWITKAVVYSCWFTSKLMHSGTGTVKNFL